MAADTDFVVNFEDFAHAFAASFVEPPDSDFSPQTANQKPTPVAALE